LPAFGLISDAGNTGCPVWCVTVIYSTCLLLLPAEVKISLTLVLSYSTKWLAQSGAW